LSAHTIYPINKGTLYDRANDVFICMGEKSKTLKDYGIGTDYDKNDFLNLYLLQRVLCNPNCEIYKREEDLKEMLNKKLLKYE